jgi:hypothetical protein
MITLNPTYAITPETAKLRLLPARRLNDGVMSLKCCRKQAQLKLVSSPRSAH